MGPDDIRAVFAGALIASCQPGPGGPTDSVGLVVAFALATRDGGARGLRIEGVANVAAVAAACDLPVIGLVKRDLSGSDVRITPFVDDAVALARAGARIVAFDATERARPVPVGEMIDAIHAAGALAMADIATLAEARAASSGSRPLSARSATKSASSTTRGWERLSSWLPSRAGERKLRRSLPPRSWLRRRSFRA